MGVNKGVTMVVHKESSFRLTVFHHLEKKRTYRHTDVRTDGWTDGCTDGRTDGRKDGGMEEWMDGWTDRVTTILLELLIAAKNLQDHLDLSNRVILLKTS